ncbi:MAG: SDR family oxidoreductase [Actinomycetota bacterium]|jgi:nucleoside-diphosphate-sugar epimerase|nr:SDR family oxidoreductase [Actinomycetota bacterium]
MKVLFIGGTGIISSACARQALELDIELTALVRGRSNERPLPAAVEVLHADIRDGASADAALGDRSFDVVVDYVAFTPEQVRADLERFLGRVGQYIFISSASAYRKPLASLPIVEGTPLANPYWQYSRDKIACEELLMAAWRDEAFPVTIVRPSHTYDRLSLPTLAGYTDIDRMRRGDPVVVHGDGTSLWVLTHHLDFARAFVGLLGNPKAIGECFHITSDLLLTWNEIYETLARAAGCEAQLVHVASETIARAVPKWGPGLLGDKAHSLMFDNTKIKRVVPGWAASIPFSQGAREIIDFYDGEASRRRVDAEADAAMDTLVGIAERS